MYRSNLKKEDQPIVLQHPIAEFEDGTETPYLVPATFLERVTSWPMVRSVVGRFQQLYENTKESNHLLNTALGYGENTVSYSWNQAACILDKAGISGRLEKPMKVADVIGCHLLDQVETKLPIVTKTPYEIKLIMGRSMEDKVDQFQTVKEATVERVKNVKENVKQLGADKVHAVMETPVGRTVNHGIEYALNTVDDVVEKYLPESRSPMNGNAANGHIKSNGFHTDNLDRARQISYKVTRRVSLKVRATSHTVVDAVIATPAVSAVHTVIHSVRRSTRSIVKKPLETVRQIAVFATAKAYLTAVDGIGKLVDVSQWTLMKVLPSFIFEPINMMLDRSVNYLVKSGFHIPPPVEIPEDMVEY